MEELDAPPIKERKIVMERAEKKTRHNEPRRDKFGRPICEICDRGFDNLGNHVKQKHGVTAAEYKQAHGYAKSKGLTSDTYKGKMRDMYDRNKDTMVSNLEKGSEARKKGE